MNNLKNVISTLIVSMTLFIFCSIIMIYNYQFAKYSEEQVKDCLINKAKTEAAKLNSQFESIGQTAQTLSLVLSTMKRYDDQTIFSIMKQTLREKELLFGVGVWLEPYAKDKKNKYFGPYFYKDKNKDISLTWDYSNEKYNYFQHDWYRNGLDAKNRVYYTKAPYYDQVLNTYFLTFSSPIYQNNRLIGVASADMTLREINDYLHSIKIGQKGYAFIATQEGKSWGGNSSGLKKLDPKGELLAYANIGQTNLRLVLVYSQKEIYALDSKLRMYNSLILFLGISLFLLIFNLIIKYVLQEPLKTIISKVEKIEKEDFSSDNLLEKICGYKNELGILARTLVSMTEHIRLLIADLKEKYEDLQFSREQIAKSEARYRLVFEATNDCLWEIDLETGEKILSETWVQLFGDGEEKTGQSLGVKGNIDSWLERVHPADQESVRKTYYQVVEGELDSALEEYRVLTKDETYRWISSRMKSLRNKKGKPILLAGARTDIHQRKVQEEEIKHMAWYDMLTGLPNRFKFSKEMNDLLTTGQTLAFIFMDIDNFKGINDCYGHLVGDELLVQIANRLKIFSNLNNVYRLGGDEFIIILPDTHSSSQVSRFLNNLAKELEKDLLINNYIFNITTSMGVAFYPRNGKSAVEILRNADIAMYNAKELGRGRYVFFDQSMNQAILERTELENQLKKAVKKREFVLHYQSQYNLKNKKISGFEALVRWNNPFRGTIPPSLFIKIAEETGLIIPIGNWVLKEACRFGKRLHDEGYSFLNISVNISPIQLMQEEFTQSTLAIIEESGFPMDNLELEITETALLESFEESNKKLKELREYGIKFALDDFGTGYSSLNYLKRLPVSTIKIDKSFIDDLINQENEKDLTELIIRIAHKIGMNVVAEGVEKEEQINVLTNYNCDTIQGYLISKPVPESEARMLL